MFQGIQGISGDEHSVPLTLYTDAYVVRGSIRTRQRRVTDILNEPDHEFLVLNDVVFDAYGSRDLAIRSEYAQINLGAVLFAVADQPVDTLPELRTAKVTEEAVISIPPFRIIGHIHVLPERSLREALEELTGRFVPVTDAVFWSETEARQSAQMIAFNHARAQILAPHRAVDPWAGLDRSREGGSRPVGEPGRAPDAVGEVPMGTPSTSVVTGAQDPWGSGGASTGEAADAQAGSGSDPWRDVRSRGSTAGPAAGETPGNPWGGPGGDPWSAGRRPSSDEPSG